MKKHICQLALIGIIFLYLWPLQTRAKDLPGDSLFQIKSQWITQDGKEMTLDTLKGKPTILAMVYLSCQFLCPTIISEVQNIEAKLSENEKKQLQIVLVSFDPTKDTPQALKAYAKKRKLDNKRWTLLTTTKEEKVRELAAALNFKYQKIPGGDYTHSFMIVVLNEEGVPIARIDAANQDKQPLVDSINKLSLLKK